MSLLVAKTKEQIKKCIKSAAEAVLTEKGITDVTLPDFVIEVILTFNSSLVIVSKTKLTINNPLHYIFFLNSQI